MKPGSILDGKYELRRRIGDGAMGVVWEGLNTRTEREVAVKLLVETGRDEDRQRLLREARAGGRIRHPNVLDIYDVAETETGSPFIVMELLRGESLAHRLERGPISLAQALRILRDVARGLAAAHKVGVVHRDLKPHNVYLHNEADTTVPTVKLVEFGISRIDTEATLTLTGVMLGSAGYVAPEQIDGRNVDHRADIWAFGVLAYELFTGEALFDGSTPAEVIQQVSSGTIPELPRIAHELDLDLRALVGGCLVRDADRRFQTIVDCGLIIERVLTRVSHPSMIALAERMPSSPMDEDEPTTVTEGPEPRTRRRGPGAIIPAEFYTRSANLDPDTVTDISVTEGTPIDAGHDLEQPPTAAWVAPVDDAEPETLANPPSADEPEPPRSLATPPRFVSAPALLPSEPPPPDSLSPGDSRRAVAMFQEALAPGSETATALGRQKRVSMIGLAVVAVLVGGIGVALILRSPSPPSAPKASPSAPVSAAPASTALAAPVIPTATADVAPAPSIVSAPSSAAPSVSPSASAAPKTRPHVVSNPSRPPVPPLPPVPPSSGAGPSYNPSTL